MRKLRVLVIGNYKPDRQESMNRFADLLIRMYGEGFLVDSQTPFAVFGLLQWLPPLLFKYIAYIDKFLLYPAWLCLLSGAYDVIHIADHGNAFYTLFCIRARSVVTCHDLLAMRGAFGDTSVSCSASSIGIFLHRLVRFGLRHASAIAFDSAATLNDFQMLVAAPPAQQHSVIHLPLNANFNTEADPSLLPNSERKLLPNAPYLLMVGSDLPRKNRALALSLIQQLGQHSPYHIVFAGAPLNSTEREFQHSNPLGGRVHSIVRPSHALLNVLYCHAHALLFPSIAEGFGWPLLEAQACGCPVLASNTTSIPEVAGSGALYASPHDVSHFSVHVYTLESIEQRSRLVGLGKANLHRFGFQQAAQAYQRLAFTA